jgi:hypothetical protein
MVVVVIRTMASVAWMIVGLGLSSNASALGPWKTSAFMVVALLPSFTDLFMASPLSWLVQHRVFPQSS